MAKIGIFLPFLIFLRIIFQVAVMRWTVMSLLLLLLILLSCTSLCVFAELQFPVHSFISYERNGVQIGARRPTYTSTLESFPPISSRANLDITSIAHTNVSEALFAAEFTSVFSSLYYKKIIYGNITNFDVKIVRQLITFQPTGFLFVLSTNSLSVDIQDQLSELQQYLLKNAIEKPFFFTRSSMISTTKLDAILQREYSPYLFYSVYTPMVVISSSIAAPSASSKEKPFDPLPSSIASPTLPSLHATLYPNSVAVPSSLPIVLIVAPIDSHTSVPTLSSTLYASSSSLLSLTLLRIFGTNSAFHTSPSSYSLMFLYTSGTSTFSQSNLRTWLNTLDPRIVENIAFALCLDTLLPDMSVPDSSSTPLYVHLSSRPDQIAIAPWIEATQSVSSLLNCSLEIRYEKPASTKTSNWPHEVFARKRIASMTLSTRESSTVDFFTSMQPFALEKEIRMEDLYTPIHMLTEIIARMTLPDNTTVTDPTAQSLLFPEFTNLASTPRKHSRSSPDLPILPQGFLSTQFAFFKNSLRFAPYLTENSYFLVHLRSLIKEYATNDALTFGSVDGIKFYPYPAVTASLYETRPLWAELILSICIGVYLFILATLSSRMSKQ